MCADIRRFAVTPAALVLLTATPLVLQSQAVHPLKKLRHERNVGSDVQRGVDIALIQALAVSPNGRIYVLDRGDYNVKVYDSLGRSSRVFSRRGRGPGELESPSNIRVNDSSVMVSDAMNGLLEFSLDGAFRRVTRHVEPIDSIPLRHGHILRVGRIDQTWGTDAVGSSGSRVCSIQLRTGRTDTIAVIGLDRARFTQTNGRPIVLPTGFGDSGFAVRINDSVLVVADGHQGLVRWYAVERDGMRMIRQADLGHRGTRVTSADRDQLLQQSAARVGGVRFGPGGDASRAASPKYQRIDGGPTLLSAATDYRISPDGAIWIGGRSRTQAPTPATLFGSAGQLWTVFPSNGAPPFSIQLPDDLSLYTVRGDLIYAIERDGATDVQIFRVIR